MLDLVGEHLKTTAFAYALHTGKVPQERRRHEINRFKQEPACRVLLSSDAGATGLNLQAANVVINLDLPWNPARLEQRIARAWRKHQRRHVSVINLVCEDSIEHRILHLLEQKRSLAEGVLEGTGETEMELPSGRRMLIERLESLMGTRLADQEPTAEEAPPAAVGLENLPHELEARHPQGLEAMAVYGTARGRQTVLAVVRGDAEARRSELASAAARTGARPAVEVVDRDTMAMIQRLVEAGILSMNAPQQTLHGTLSIGSDSIDCLLLPGYAAVLPYAGGSMARLSRFVLLGQPQHIIQRGNNRKAIFCAGADYRFYLEKLHAAATKHRCEIHAYVLMANRVHLLLTPQTENGIGKLSKCWNTSNITILVIVAAPGYTEGPRVTVSR